MSVLRPIVYFTDSPYHLALLQTYEGKVCYTDQTLDQIKCVNLTEPGEESTVLTHDIASKSTAICAVTSATDTPLSSMLMYVTSTNDTTHIGRLDTATGQTVSVLSLNQSTVPTDATISPDGKL